MRTKFVFLVASRLAKSCFVFRLFIKFRVGRTFETSLRNWMDPSPNLDLWFRCTPLACTDLYNIYFSKQEIALKVIMFCAIYIWVTHAMIASAFFHCPMTQQRWRASASRRRESTILGTNDSKASSKTFFCTFFRRDIVFILYLYEYLNLSKPNVKKKKCYLKNNKSRDS